MGAEVFCTFENAGYSVVATARKTGESLIKLDLGIPESIIPILNKYQPDVIINCAAVADFTANIKNKLYPVNSLAPAIMASWCMTKGSYLVQASALLVHGVITPYIDSETSILLDTDYGKSKYLAEQMIEISGAKSAIIRFCGIFGANGPKHLGLNNMIRKAQKGIKPKIIGRGLAKRNYIHVSDAADILLACVKNQIQGVRWAGGKEVNNITEIFNTLCEVYKLNPPLMEDGNESNDQVVKISDDLPIGKTFYEALISEL